MRARADMTLTQQFIYAVTGINLDDSYLYMSYAGLIEFNLPARENIRHVRNTIIAVLGEPTRYEEFLGQGLKCVYWDFSENRCLALVYHMSKRRNLNLHAHTIRLVDTTELEV